MKEFFDGVIITLTVLILGFSFGMGFAISYNYFNNKTKKVCDLCFRDIKRFNELYKKNGSK